MQKRQPAKSRATPPARHRRIAHGDTVVLYGVVALGSALGGTLRALASLALAGTALPWATLLVNVAGSFAIGFYATLTGPDGRVFAGPRQRHFVMTGVCGGFTTFSIFSLEALRFVEAGVPGAAGLLVAVSVTAWLAAVWLGHRLAVRLNRPGG